jgi:hypothetical protein
MTPMYRKIDLLIAGLLFAALFHAPTALALEVDEISPPRISVEAEFFGTLDYTKSGSANPATPDVSDIRANTDDTNLTVVFDKPLYDQSLVAGMVVNLELGQEGVTPRVSTFLASSRFRIGYGRSKLRNTLVRFPTVRDDDLLAYTHVLNSALGLEESDAQMYGDILSLDWSFRPSHWRVSLFGQEREQTRLEAGSGTYVADEAARANSGGLSLIYEPPEPVRYEGFVRQFGLIYEVQSNDRISGERARHNSSVLGAVIGVNDNPEYPWEIALQVVNTGGLEDRDGTGTEIRAQSEDALAREAATATVLSVQYANRRYLQTRWRGALTLAHKSYGDIDGASQWSLVPAWFHRIGNGVDLVTQVVYTAYDDGLASIVGQDSEMTVQVGITLQFEDAINDNVVEPGSILELEHGRMY